MHTEARLISERRLARLLAIGYKTLQEYRISGKVTPDANRATVAQPDAFEANRNESPHLYSLNTVDALLQAEGCARNFPAEIPTATELLDADGDLLTVEETAARLGKRPDDIYRLIQLGKLAAFYIFGWMVRLPPRQVAAAHAAMHNDDAIEAGLASRLLCMHRDRFVGWVRTGGTPFAPVAVLGEAGVLHVSREVLLEVLATQLPHYVTPQEWWQIVVQYSGEMATIQQLAHLCRSRKQRVKQRIEDEKIPFIKTLGGITRIPVATVQSWIDDAATLTMHDLSEVFGTWRIIHVPRRSICSANHGRAKASCPQRSCVRAYIARHATPGIDPDQWLQAALGDGSPPVALGDLLGVQANLDAASVHGRIMRGELPCVWMPGAASDKEPVIPATHLHLL